MLSGQAETHFMMEMIFLGSNVSTKKQVEWADTQCVSPLVVSHLFETPWTTAHQASLSMGFSRQEYWSW